MSATAPPRQDARLGRIVTLRQRAEFLRIRGGLRQGTVAFVLEGKARTASPGGVGPRFGFTITRQVGNAVQRNRIRRRLREALRTLPSACVRPDFDYVLVARPAALERTFAELVAGLRSAFERLHATRPAGRRAAGGPA